jgi:hypothetical protein
MHTNPNQGTFPAPSTLAIAQEKQIPAKAEKKFIY